MGLDLFRRIIDQGAANGLCSIKLSFRGEPLLHPQLPEMVAYAKAKGILDVYFNTNATLLRENTIHRLLDAGLDRISISIEGVTKEAYEAVRVGAKYEEVVANVETLRRIRETRGFHHPQIRIQTVLSPDMKAGFQEYVRFWQPLADEVAYLDMRREGPEDDHRGQVANWACPMLWQRMAVLWDGVLLPCLMHGVADFALMALGNVRQVEIKEMWLGKREEHFRELHRAGRAHELEACDRCSYRGMELEKMRLREAGARR
jgi:radical SAM protein with 4Fe4S-binding SPASM domain